MNRKSQYNGVKKWILIQLCIYAFMIWIMGSGAADAHYVTIFAWVDGDTVFTESKFGGGKKVIAGDIIIYDSKGRQLLQGKTDTQGKFSFKVPQKTTMKIVLLAGMGHRAEWTVTVDEITDSLSEQSPASRAGGTAEKKVAVVDSNSNRGLPAGDAVVNKPVQKIQPLPPAGLSSADLDLAIEKALDKKLKPVIKMLAELQEKTPTVTDIIGGIGYILGLVGIAAYFHSRKQKNERNNQKPPS